MTVVEDVLASEFATFEFAILSCHPTTSYLQASDRQCGIRALQESVIAPVTAANIRNIFVAKRRCTKVCTLSCLTVV